MENKINLIYKLEGSSIDEGVDVYELAPLLLAIGGLIQESRKELIPNSHEIAVNIKPFENGSFMVDIVLFAKTNFQSLIDLVKQDSVQEIKTLLEWIGLISGSGVGVIGVIKHLKNKPKKVTPLKDGTVLYTSQNDQTIAVNSKVHQLLCNSKIVNAIINIYQAPLQSGTGISKVSSFLKNDLQTQIQVVAEDMASFERFENGIGTTEDDVMENITDVYLNPKRGSFEGEANAWSFRRGDNRAIIPATIRDEEFLAKLRKGDIRLFQNDLLKVKLLEKQKIRGHEIQTSMYEIINVLEYRKSPEQPSLSI